VVLADHGPVQESTDDAYIGGEVTTLSAKAAGFIQTVTVADNQSVKTGDLLLKLEDRDYVRPPSWPAPNMTSTGIEHCARIILLPANVSNRLTQTMRKRGRRSAGRGRRSMLQSASSMSLPRKSSRPKPLSIKLWPSAISRCSILPIQKFARQSTG